MNYPKQSGVALVITLLMLSVVTFMAVVFLAVSRREKASVVASSDLTDAKLMTDAALARAQGEVLSHILAATNVGAYNFLVSTNYTDPLGYFRPQAQPGINVTNVGYWTQGQDPNRVKPIANKLQRIQGIANLMYDPRPPVFIRTNFTLAANNPNAWDFRFFLDLNRNGLFEDTRFGSIEERSETNFVTGDPQWVGMLEHPDRPHSETNRFVGRYAFLALPAGKSLDVNFIHNYAKRINPQTMPTNTDSFFRNQGVGSWELNLAGFLRELNTNLWRTYNFRTDGLANQGDAFADAVSILRYRYGKNGVSPNTSTLLNSVASLGPGAANLLTAGIDIYAEAPLRPVNLNNLNLPWWGSDSENALFDVQEIYDANQLSPALAARFKSPRVSNINATSYDRYTFYRMLAQMGVDSRTALSNRLVQADFELHPTNKFNLNYQPALGDVTTLGLVSDPRLPWDPLPDTITNRLNASRFFHLVADRLLRASLTTNVLADSTGKPKLAFALGEMPVRPELSITNIQISPPTAARKYSQWETNVEYTAALHRVLQVAANIYDATTSRRIGTNAFDFPTVFRPLFRRGPEGQILIAGFAEVTNSVPARNNVWIDISIPAERARISTDPLHPSGFNIIGVPWVIGAKKGLPNFNEFSLETAVQVSRKLEIRRLAARTFLTNQMYVIGISNMFGVEAWNSYTQTVTRPLELVATNFYSFALRSISGSTGSFTTNLIMASGIPRPVGGARLITPPTGWPGSASAESILTPIRTNRVLITNNAYLSRQAPYLFDPLRTNNFEASLDPPRLYLFMTNRLHYWLIDRATDRILDFVNLDGLNGAIDVATALVGEQNYFGDKTTIREADLWRYDRRGTAPNVPTLGILSQIAVSSGDPRVAADVWASHLTTREQKQSEIDAFKRFLAGTSTNTAIQAPFTPTRKIYQRLSWQANDPLVHYTMADLSDAILSSSAQKTNYAILRPIDLIPTSNLGLANQRYRPWGNTPARTPGSPNRSSENDPVAFSMAAKDPLIRSSDDWVFPTNKFPNIGWLGRVHRGTPWQTIYLKSEMLPLDDWTRWNGDSPAIAPPFRPHAGTHPTNDWKFLDLFTVAPNANAARGLLSVNQTNTAAWSALLSGVQVTSHSIPAAGGMLLQEARVNAASPEIQTIVNGINRTRDARPNRVFENLGDVLASPELTVASPFLKLTSPGLKTILGQRTGFPRDEVVERIPQQVLSLLKSDEPRIVVYAFGQSLKPAERSIVTSGSFYNICTNYQITGEVVAKAVLRIDDAPKRPHVVVESYNILPPD